MENFKKIFNDWINNKVDYQIDAIDKICNELNIQPNEWFSHYLNRNSGDFSRADILNEMLSYFLFYISNEFQKPLFKYITPKGHNIYNEPYLGLGFNLKYNLESGLYIKKKQRKKFRKFCDENLTFDQKKDLLYNDNLFSRIINKTNLKIFSKREIRTLKLQKLNLCQTE